MTVETVLAWSGVRALLMSTIALPLAMIVGRVTQQRNCGATSQRILIVTALLPLFVPDLLIGFTYRLTSAHLVHSVVATELLYALLLLFRIIALQTAVGFILPDSGVSREAMHAWRLNRHHENRKQFAAAWWVTWLRLQISGPARAPLVAWMSGALLCFQEFETAALLQIDRHPIAWTVWLFDAHAAGEPLMQTLKFIAPAVALQAFWLIPCMWLVARGPALQATGTQTTTFKNNSSLSQITAWTVIAISLSAVFLWPILTNAWHMVSGFKGLLNQQSLVGRLEQILTSVTEASIAAVLALQIAIGLYKRRNRFAVIAALLPGLCGALYISFLLLATFQLSFANIFYDTWLPMIVGHTLLMLPRAFLLVTVLNIVSSKTARHSGELLASAADKTIIQSAAKLAWSLHQRRWVIAFIVLAHWCLWDVTIASTLRPVWFEPIVTRLYNEMHYGRTESLVAITALTLIAPVVIYFFISLCSKVLMPKRHSTS